jgi:hypothetical protein
MPSTLSPDYVWRSTAPMPRFLVDFFAETGIPVPAPGQYVPIATIDKVLGDAGLDISNRIALKSHLRAYDLILP